MYSPSTVATEGGGVAVGDTGVPVGVGNWVGVPGGAKEAQADMLKTRSRIKILFKKWGLKNIIKIIPTY
jgi:hypothetical protein